MSVFRVHQKRACGAPGKTRRWYVETRDHRGRRCRIAGFESKRATEALERGIIDLVAVRCVGLPLDRHQRAWVEGLPPRVRKRLSTIGVLRIGDTARLTPVLDSLDAWESDLTSRGTKARRIAELRRYVRMLLDATGLVVWSELSARAVRQGLVEVQRTRGWTDETVRRHAQGIRQLCRWAVTEGLLSEDPLRSLGRVGLGVRSGRQRRALTSEEIGRLLSATARGPDDAGMPGPERALLYQLVLETGLRRNEVRKLRVRDFDLAPFEDAAVRITAESAKNKRTAYLPLRLPLARQMRAQLAHRPEAEPAFGMYKSWRAATVLRADLERAGIAPVVATGRVVDFHALRVTFSTNLARANVPIQIAQKLLRHSTPVLTSNIYTVLDRSDQRRAVERLPDCDGRLGEEGDSSPAEG